MEIKNPLHIVDNFLKIQAAKVKFKINDDDKYLALIKTFGVWNSSAKQKQSINSPNTEYKGDYLSNILTHSGLLNIFVINPYIGIPVFVYSATCWDNNSKKIINYENKLNTNSSGLKKIENLLEDNIDYYTRLSNLGLGFFYLSKPIIEFSETKSVSMDSLVGLGLGSTLISIGISQYLINSDDDGLKNKQKEEEFKGLENLVLQKI